MSMFHTFFWLPVCVDAVFLANGAKKGLEFQSPCEPFFHFFLVEFLMNDTMEGRFPFCHNRDPAATQILSKKVASKHNGSSFAVSLLPIQTIFDYKSSEVTFEF